MRLQYLNKSVDLFEFLRKFIELNFLAAEVDLSLGSELVSE